MKERKVKRVETTTARQFTAAEVRKALGVPVYAELLVPLPYGDSTPIDEGDVVQAQWTITTMEEEPYEN